MKLRLCPILIMLALLSSTAFAQQLTGTVSGVVRDSQGGVMPGVTVTVASEALIGGPRTIVTGDNGGYQFGSLPPGLFDLTFELAGFATLKREDVRVQVAQNTRIDVDLRVGDLQESVTVSGESPIVDVANTTTQTNIDKEFFEAVPTSRNPWVMAALVPSVVAASGCWRHRGDAAVPTSGVWLGRQSENVLG